MIVAYMLSLTLVKFFPNLRDPNTPSSRRIQLHKVGRLGEGHRWKNALAM